jgi:hypothetical protein
LSKGQLQKVKGEARARALYDLEELDFGQGSRGTGIQS